ncbi:asparaginase [Dyella caseinilytica]|uniref:Asparaginase n=1 Tax=Dyella caseinilytica TaxID=1849581 RepID=A0ABX7GWS1_9GAMM|nr:asparaginase [Dyella caseinilytica]QRN54309.1 asparaginase [Dyella caseinilytica]GFZ93186.1 L-asparaginase [Dyella caseinilytica]
MKPTSLFETSRLVLGYFGLAMALAVAAVPASAQTAANTTQNAPAPAARVLVLGTGGTIAGQASTRGSGAYNAGKVSAADLIAAVPGIDKIAQISTDQVASIGSQDMNDKVWFDLVKRIQLAIRNKEADGIVITHGTDTMEETAFFLQTVLDTRIPVVLVGSMRPSTAIGADGPANLYEAVKVAASPDARGRGVLVVLDDAIHGARWVQKTNTTNVQTFESRDAGPVGYVDMGPVRFLRAASPYNGSKLKLPDAPPLPRVDIVYAHANMDGLPVEDAVKRGAKGIVLAGVGDGNTSKEAIDALQAAAKAGIVVVRSTRVGSGFVNRNVEVDDDKRGFVVSLDLNPQKARVLLQLLIANGITQPQEVQKHFDATW